jgi:hypothetical protein
MELKEDQPVPAPDGFVMKRGEYYDSLGPAGERIVMMTRETWLDYGTLVEKQRTTMADQNNRINELLEECRSITTSLNNLRDVRRSEKRPDIEGGLILPGSNRFKSKS